MEEQICNYTGTIGKIFPIETSNLYQWRKIWVMKDNFYTKKNGEVVNTLKVVEFKLTRGNVQLVENLGLRVGSDVVIDFFVDGRMYKNRPWVSLVVHKIMSIGFTSVRELGLDDDDPGEPVVPPVLHAPPREMPIVPSLDGSIPEKFRPEDLVPDDDLPF